MSVTRRALKLHADSRCSAVRRVEAEVARPQPGTVLLRYIVSGDTGQLVLPPIAAPIRTDELWRHTCFEAFVRRSSGAAYCEFNFAPSTQWAAYRFDDYREGMRPLGELGPPQIQAERTPERFILQAALQFAHAGGEAWRVGICAVLEETSGNKSYWALGHPPGKPDFHHADGFVLELQ